jgi:hypothetical protein
MAVGLDDEVGGGVTSRWITPAWVHGVQCPRCLRDDGHRLGRAEPAGRGDQLIEGLALDVGRDEERGPRVGTRVVVVDVGHARVVQGRHAAGFVVEPGGEGRVGGRTWRSTLTATARSSRVSVARHTSPMPPPATGSSNR